MKTELIEQLKREIKPALGCTEPVAVAYAASIAKNLLGEKVKAVDVTVNSNLYKNGMGVFVPGTQKTGLFYSVALGVLFGDESKVLEVLEGMPRGAENKAERFLKEADVRIEYLPGKTEVYVEVVAKGEKHSSRVLIVKSHGNVVLRERNGIIIDDRREDPGKEAGSKEEISELNIKELIRVIQRMTVKDLEFLNPAIEANMKIAKHGVKNKRGVGVGYTLEKLMEKKIMKRDWINKSKALTAGASDARMSGEVFPVYSCGGSGNQGLAASIPVIVMAEALNFGEEDLLQGLALSFLVTLYVKQRIGRLSALCGCGVAAGVGSAVAIGNFMGMKPEVIEGGINNIVGNLTGMVCDGAKPGCALKLSTSVGTVMEMMFLAKEGALIQPGEGIVGRKIEDTLNHLETLSYQGMEGADDTILKIMISQQS